MTAFPEICPNPVRSSVHLSAAVFESHDLVHPVGRVLRKLKLGWTWWGCLWPLDLCTGHSGTVGRLKGQPAKGRHSIRGTAEAWNEQGSPGSVSLSHSLPGVIRDAPIASNTSFYLPKLFWNDILLWAASRELTVSPQPQTHLYLLFSGYTYFKWRREFSTAIPNSESISITFFFSLQ